MTDAFTLLFGADTSDDAAAVLIEGYRRMQPAERLKRACDLSLTVQQLALARIRAAHPDATERELRLRLASLSIERALMIRAFGWDPEVHGY